MEMWKGEGGGERSYRTGLVGEGAEVGEGGHLQGSCVKESSPETCQVREKRVRGKGGSVIEQGEARRPTVEHA